MFGFGKKAVAAEVAGHNFTVVITDADDSWNDVCQLRQYSSSGLIATCEMALARAALTKVILSQHSNQQIAERLMAALDRCVALTFTGQDTDESMEHYGEPMETASTAVLSIYFGAIRDQVTPTSALASTLAQRLGVPGMAFVEVTPLFDRVEERVRSMLGKFKIV